MGKLYWPRESFHTELSDGSGVTLQRHSADAIVEEGHELLSGGRMSLFEEVFPTYSAPPAPKPQPRPAAESTRVVDEPKSAKAK